MKRSWPLFAVLAVLGLAQGGLPYPEGYRFWTHVKSMELKPGHPLYESFGGLHHIYVNPTGLRTYLEGKKAPFPKGTVIVFDEFLNYPGWKDGERKAFDEFIGSTGMKYEWLGYCRYHEQAALIIR